MAEIKELLELRKQIKNKKPDFTRQDSHKKIRLGRKWRRPKGLHSKIRLNFRGRAKCISIGYRSPKKVRHLHKSGLKQCAVSSIKDLETLDNKKNCILISSSVGDRKRILILKKAGEMGFSIVNIKNPEGYIKKVEDVMISKKRARKEVKGKVKESGKETEKTADKAGEEDRKKTEKKEKDKILTKKEK